MLAPIAASIALLCACARAPEEVYVPADYASWAKTTGIVLNYPIPGHEDRLRVPRMNAKGFSAKPSLEGGKLRWDFPEDTVIVKEVFPSARPSPGEGPIQLTIMVKDPKDKRAQGGWLWYTRDMPNGKETLFTGNFCVTCHANANEQHPYGDGNPTEEFRDYVYFVPGETAAKAAAEASASARPRRKRRVMMKKCRPCTAKVMKVSMSPGLIRRALTI
jgi:hypothetical protein